MSNLNFYGNHPDSDDDSDDPEIEHLKKRVEQQKKLYDGLEVIIDNPKEEDAAIEMPAGRIPGGNDLS